MEIAQILEVTTDYLLFGTEKESDWPLSKVPCKQDGETGRVSVQIIGDSRRKYGITVPIKYRC